MQQNVASTLRSITSTNTIGASQQGNGSNTQRTCGRVIIDKQQYARLAREARARRKADGLCQTSKAHGPATQGLLCDACREKKQKRAKNARDKQSQEKRKQLWQARKKRREHNKKKGFCIIAKAHGKATHGILCKECREYFDAKRAERAEAFNARRRLLRERAKIVVSCMMGKRHGPAIDGKWCAACVERQRLAAQRVKEKRGL